MNAKITMIKLSQLMAANSDKTQKECEEFLRVLFQHIAEGLESGESVKIKGFGTFKLAQVESRKSVDVTTGEDNEIPAHRRIVFVPAKELAAAVNAPFEMFETVVLDENVLEEELAQAEIEGNETLVTTIEERIIEDEKKMDSIKAEMSSEGSEQSEGSESKVASSTDEKEIKEPKEIEASLQSEESENPEKPENIEKPETSEACEETEESISPDVKDDKTEESTEKEEARKGWKTWWLYIAAAIVVIFIGVGGMWWLNDDFRNWTTSWQITGKDKSPSAAVISDMSAEDVASATENQAEVASGVDAEIEDIPTEEMSAKEEAEKDDVVPTKASDQKVYDTVTDTRYLSTIAKEHYGNYNLWPYIYKENEKILGHPNRIRPGTRVVIPDLSKYGVDPKNKGDIEKAKKLGVEIYSRYDKKNLSH